MTRFEQDPPDIERFAKIIGDATRIRMLQLLMEGRALTAKELAYGARVEPATATQHLRRLQEGGLISVKAPAPAPSAAPSTPPPGATPA